MMPRHIKTVTIAVFLMLISAVSSKAVIAVQNVFANANSNPTPFTQSIVGTPTGSKSDFEIITCGTVSRGGNSFLAPGPDIFDPLDLGSCGNGSGCIQGIWSRFVDTPGASENFCNWTDQVNVFGAGSIRWSGVDRENPVTAIACNTGESEFATAPSVDAEEGSYVVRIYTLAPVLDLLVGGASFISGEFTAIAVFQGQELVVHGRTDPAEGAGPTGTADYSIERFLSWRACTIALRPEARNIPTLSEWGLGIFAALTVIAAAWALRRRSVKA